MLFGHSLFIKADKLDADPYDLNTPAGIVDLKTGKADIVSLLPTYTILPLTSEKIVIIYTE